MGGDAKPQWVMDLGWLAIFLAMGLAVVVFILPVFEGYRSLTFWAVIVPLVAIGAFLILFKRNG